MTETVMPPLPVSEEDLIMPVDGEEEGENVITEYFITDEDTPQMIGKTDLIKKYVNTDLVGTPTEIVERHEELLDVETALDVAKAVDGSRQIIAGSRSLEKEVSPPYDPQLLLTFMQMDEVVHQVVKTKALDSVGRGYRLEPLKPVKITPAKHDNEDKDALDMDAVRAEVEIVELFISLCNENYGFQSVLYRAALDLESIGWAAIEVIRGVDKQIKKIDHIPAARIKPLRGWEGFIERQGQEKVHFQPFGQKVMSSAQTSAVTDNPLPYDPTLDDEEFADADWNMIDYETGESTSNFAKSASEVIWIQKHHPATIYYGISDTLPASAHVLANINIRNYLLQFFEHNTVPRFVVIIKGARVSPEVKEAILNYFQTHVRGRAHKTLVIPIPTGRGNVEVIFEKLDSDPKDGWFRESAKDSAHSIRMAHGVPASIAGFNDSASLGSGKGLAQAETYKDRVVTPAQNKWAEVVNELFKVGLGIKLIHLVFNQMDTRDEEAETRTVTTLQDRGDLSINEVRARLNYPPIPGGNRHFIKGKGGELIFIDELENAKGALKLAEEQVTRDEAAQKRSEDKPADPGGDRRVDIPAAKAPENSVDAVMRRGGKE